MALYIAEGGVGKPKVIREVPRQATEPASLGGIGVGKVDAKKAGQRTRADRRMGRVKDALGSNKGASNHDTD